MAIRLFVLTMLLFVPALQTALASEETTHLSALKLADVDKNALSNFLEKLGYESIPIFKKGSMFYVQGKAANQPVYFLLDTGSINANILADGVEQLKLNIIQSDEKTSNATGEIKFAKKVVISPIRIGKFQISEISANVMEQPFKHDLPTIVIGNEFFVKYNAIIDTNQAKLYLTQNQISTRDQQQLKKLLESYHYQNVPLTKLSSGHFVLPIQINNAMPVYLLFDTGTSDTTLSIAYAAYLNIKPRDGYKTQAATDGSITFAEINVEKITFNPLKTFFAKPIELSNLKVASANVESLSAFLEVVGIIGLADMKKLHAIIDIPAQSVFLTS